MSREALERAGQELWTDTELLPDFVGTDGNDVLTPNSAGVTWGMDGDDILVSEDNGYLNFLVGGDGDDIYVIEPGSVSFIQAGDGHDKLDVSSFANRNNPFILVSEAYSYPWRMSATSRNELNFLYDPITKTTIACNDRYRLRGTIESIIYDKSVEFGEVVYNSEVDGRKFEWPEIFQLHDEYLNNQRFNNIPAKAWNYFNELINLDIEHRGRDFYQRVGNSSAPVLRDYLTGEDRQTVLDALLLEIEVINDFYDQILNQLSPDLPDPQALAFQTRPTIELGLGQDEIYIHENSNISLPIIHTADYTDGRSTGISANIFYDSSILALPVSTSGLQDNVLTAGSITNNGITTEGTLIHDSSLWNDIEDLDNDPSTDMFMNVTWGDTSGEFPNVEGSQIGSITFNTADNLVDPVTGQKTTTTVNIIPVEAPTGYQTRNKSILFTPYDPQYSLDVDGDGEVSALGDGLMIIRKLFGYAFAGNSLTSKAISTKATRSADEIHDYIQTGIDNLSLDVDKDGKVTALGDGLMIIRRLFGSAFAGDALTSKAISHESSYIQDSSPWEAISHNIDKLMPPDQPLA